MGLYRDLAGFEIQACGPLKAPQNGLVRVTNSFLTGMIKPCRECQRQVSDQAPACPNCGAPFPAKEKWDGWGFEYKSQTTLLGFPLVHISFKYRPNRVPVPARGVIAIGQFACGLITISQFGIGLVSISQFTIAVYALAQLAFAYSLIAQIGIYIHQGHGQLVKSLAGLFGVP